MFRRELNKKTVLNKNQLIEISDFGIKIEKHFSIPQDIEWTIEKNEIFILQSRPISSMI